MSDDRPPELLTSAELRARIISRCRKVIRECEQAIRDAEYWNGLPHNQCHTPMDVEDFRVQRQFALRTLKEFGEAT